MEEEALFSLLLTMAYELALIGCDERTGTVGRPLPREDQPQKTNSTVSMSRCSWSFLLIMPVVASSTFIISPPALCGPLVVATECIWHFIYLFTFFHAPSPPRDRPPAPVNHRE